MSKKPTSRSNKTDSRLEFAKALNTVTQKEEAFIKSVEALKEFSKEALIQLNIEIETKETRLDILDNEFEATRKNKQIEIDQYLAEYKYKAALEYLKEREEEPIDCDDLSKLREQLKSHEKDQKEDLDKVIEEERKNAKTALNAVINNAKLTHKADTAELNATVKQLQREIETYKGTIENQKNEIAEQRKLTMQVAQAGRQAPISQSFGKQ